MININARKAATRPEIPLPVDYSKALSNDPKAKAQWDDLTPIARRDFVSWIESAKQLDTRKRRIEVACSKLRSGQRRPCCYTIVPMDLYKALGSDPKAKTGWSALTPDGRRDFVSWVEAVQKPEQKLRIAEACAMLSAGKQQPS